MIEVLEFLLKLVSILTIIFTSVRLFFTITNRSIIEIILIPNSRRMWEEFVEIMFLVFFLLLSLTLPVIVEDLVMSDIILGILVALDLITFALSFLVIIMYGTICFFTHKIRKYVKMVNIAIFVNMISIFISSGLITIILKSYMIQKIRSKDFIELIFIYLFVYILYIAIFYAYRKVYGFFNGRKQVAYKVQLCDTELLNRLYFIFTLDNERHVFSDYPINRKHLSLPAYLYYPKEKILYKYFKE